MITVSADRLVFSFPERDARLDARVAAFIEAGAAAMLKEDRGAALDAVLARHPWAGQTAAWQQEARAQVARTDDAKWAAAYEALLWSRAGGRTAQRPQHGVTISFMRTLRLPDDGKAYPLPPGLGCFPLRRIEDLGAATPPSWQRRGGVALPMYQGEAMWLAFSAPFAAALKIAAGGVNAATGEPFEVGLKRDPQDYVVLPQQPWLDGFCVEKGVVRQFVAMPLGQGYSAEEQITGEARTGGVQLAVVPLKDEVRWRELQGRLRCTLEDLVPTFLPPLAPDRLGPRAAHAPMPPPMAAAPAGAAGGAMGLGAGGRMKQSIFHDPRPLDDYDLEGAEACFLHVLNSAMWRAIAHEAPPQPPVTAEEYSRHGLPWFDYYRDDLQAIRGSGILAKLKSVFAVAAEKEAPVFQDEGPMPALEVVHLGPSASPNSVRGWRGV